MNKEIQKDILNTDIEVAQATTGIEISFYDYEESYRSLYIDKENYNKIKKIAESMKW